MELSTTQTLSTPTLPKLLPPPNPNSPLLLLLSKPYPFLSISPARRSLPLLSRSLHSISPVLRASLSEESSSVEEPIAVKEPDSTVAVEDGPAPETNSYGDSGLVEMPPEEPASDLPSIDFLSDLNIKSEDTYPVIFYGTAALAVLWLTSAIVGAIDSIPLFPKLMEVVGLGYSFWFTTRYLLFKKSREELAAKIEELKEQVLGSDG